MLTIRKTNRAIAQISSLKIPTKANLGRFYRAMQQHWHDLQQPAG